MSEKTRQNIDQASAAGQTVGTKFGSLWCDFMHDAPMWPIHGKYECRICGRRYPVTWAGDTLVPVSANLIPAEQARIRRAGIPSFRSATLPNGETGAVVRQSGYLVKRPSIFVKRVEVTRETALCDGIAAVRITHLSVDTRLVGRAELIIHERPYAAMDSGPALTIAER